MSKGTQSTNMAYATQVISMCKHLAAAPRQASKRRDEWHRS
jgi:hypothetical protein